MKYINELLGIDVKDENSILVTTADIKKEVLEHRFKLKIIDNIKVMTESEFISSFVFETNPQIVLYIIENNPWGEEQLKYEIAKQVEIALRVIEILNLKQHYLFEYLKQIQAAGLSFSSKELPKLDVQFHLPRISTLTSIYTTNKLLIKEPQNQIVDNYNYYMEEVEAAIEYVMKLVSKGVDVSNIHLFAPSDYHPLIRQVGMIYKLPLATSNELPILAHPDGVRVYNQILTNSELDLNEIEPLIGEGLVAVLNKYAKYNRNQYKKLICSELESERVTINRFSGLELHSKIDSLYTTQQLRNDYFILLGNYQDGLVKYSLDIDIISDEFRQDLITIDAQNKNEDMLLYNLINNAKNIKLSFASRLVDKDVEVANNLNMMTINHISEVEASCYSYESNYLRYARANYINSVFNMKTKDYLALDKYFAIKIKDNQFQGLNYKPDNLKLSYTSINDYYKCAYKFYLSHILRVKNGKIGTDKILHGNIVHHILEGINNEHVLDKKSIQNKINEYLKTNDITIDKSIELYINKLANYLEHVCTNMQSEEGGSGYSLIQREQEYEMSLSNDITLLGKIDKVMSKVEGDNLLFQIYDYKTGSLNIDIKNIKYGLNMQNLIYFILLKNYYKHEAGEEVLIGTYQHQLKQKLLYDDEELLDTMKIEGYSKLKHEIVFKRKEKVLSEDEINQLVSLVEANIKAACDGIVKSQFTINPKIIKDKNESCKYCDYFGICNKTSKDHVFLK